MVFLPSGEEHRARRSAEHGDLSPLQCGCVISDVTAAAIANMRARKGPDHNLACFRFLFADDGQYICRTNDEYLFFGCLDRAATEAGFTRGTGRDVKWAIRRSCDESAFVAFCENHEDSWVTNRIRDAYQILHHNSRLEVLGTIIGIAI